MMPVCVWPRVSVGVCMGVHVLCLCSPVGTSLGTSVCKYEPVCAVRLSVRLGLRLILVSACVCQRVCPSS